MSLKLHSSIGEIDIIYPNEFIKTIEFTAQKDDCQQLVYPKQTQLPLGTSWYDNDPNYFIKGSTITQKTLNLDKFISISSNDRLYNPPNYWQDAIINAAISEFLLLIAKRSPDFCAPFLNAEQINKASHYVAKNCSHLETPKGVLIEMGERQQFFYLTSPKNYVMAISQPFKDYASNSDNYRFGFMELYKERTCLIRCLNPIINLYKEIAQHSRYQTFGNEHIS